MLGWEWEIKVTIFKQQDTSPLLLKYGKIRRNPKFTGSQ